MNTVIAIMWIMSVIGFASCIYKIEMDIATENAKTRMMQKQYAEENKREEEKAMAIKAIDEYRDSETKEIYVAA